MLYAASVYSCNSCARAGISLARMGRWSGRGCTVRPSAPASRQVRPWAIKSGKLPSRELRIRAILLRLTLSLVAVIGAVLANYHTLGPEYTHGGIRGLGVSA